jgi:threonylcarbamoyladenosine tRNA methylthiotransferase MtaB
MAKARGEINRLRRLNPTAKIAVIGCGAFHDPDNFKAADYVGWAPVLETDAGQDRAAHVGSNLLPPHAVIPAKRSRGLLRIQNGCDQFCAYCIVPHLRGLSRSVPEDQCIAALQDILKRGVREIVLTGTNIALWGRDLPGKPSLQDLLRSLVAHLGNARVRLSSLEPQLISPEFLHWCLTQATICRHFHLAVQSGSGRVLGLMNRGKPAVNFFQSVQEIRRSHPDVSLGADVIAGLPGESLADFEKTKQLVRDIPFSYLHVFPYSERRGTHACKSEDQVPRPERLRRAKVLRGIDRSLRKQFLALNDGRLHDIVTLDTTKLTIREGLTSNYLRVKIDPKNRLPANRFKARTFSKGTLLTLNQ